MQPKAVPSNASPSLMRLPPRGRAVPKVLEFNSCSSILFVVRTTEHPIVDAAPSEKDRPKVVKITSSLVRICTLYNPLWLVFASVPRHLQAFSWSPQVKLSPLHAYCTQNPLRFYRGDLLLLAS